MLMRTTAIGIGLTATLILAISTFGCGKNDRQSPASDGGDADSAKPPPARTLPDDVELSKVAGVSIVQCPPGDYQGRGYSLDSRSSSIVAQTAPLPNVLHAWCPFDGWIMIEAEFPDALYNIKVEAEEGASSWPLAKQAFEQVFGLRFVESMELTDVYVIRKIEGAPRGLTESTAESSGWGTKTTSGGFGYEVRGGYMQTLVNIVSDYVDKPVLDETGLTGFYKFVLAMDHWKPETVFSGVEKLGLKLEKTKRKLHIMRILYAKSGAAESTEPTSSTKPSQNP